MKQSILSPKEFLKARRPERFSDSLTEDVADVDRSMLEYHLDTLTSRSQETEFEEFARSLIKKEICPNLLPQTGPTGGGDSKVDSETYPVADELALAWHVGTKSKAASERWAFAFSAKKQWRGKLKSDIAKIAATGRGYTRAFFVTNQYVSDKKRADLEDELRESHKLDVRILDRTWILDAVFDHGRQDLAIEKLGVSSNIRQHVRLGPRDYQRKGELERFESRIEEQASQGNLNFVTVDDCINAAITSREMELPESEVTGKFDRAERMAAKYGSQRQKICCAYERAWTNYFWFEDIPKCVELYGIVEDLVMNNQNIKDLELLSNLWTILQGHTQLFQHFDSHTEVLIDQLEVISMNEDAPSAALQARASLTMIAMIRDMANDKPLDPHLSDFSEIIKGSDALPGFPFLSLSEILSFLGNILGHLPEFISLHDELVEVVAKRKSDVEGARFLLQRAEQQLDLDRPVDAISSVGKALHRLAKEESRNDFYHALHICARAYEKIGLLWAARGTLLMLVSVLMSDLWNYEDVTSSQAICIRRMKWIELQLGRIPQALSWHELDSTIRGILIAKGYEEEPLKKGDREFDVTLGLLFLKTDFRELKDITRLPDQLSSMGLNMASIALLYALGHKSEFHENLEQIPESQDELSIFANWRDQPASKDLPETPNFCNQLNVTFSARVLGCTFDVSMPNEPPFVELGESFLSALESTFATGIARRALTHTPKCNVTFKRSQFCKEPLEFEFDDELGYPCLTVRCRKFEPDALSREQLGKIKGHFAEMVGHLFARLTLFNEEQAEQIFREDSAFSRAIDFTANIQVVGNILGENDKREISTWIDKDLQEYPVKREKAWDADCPQKVSSSKPVSAEKGQPQRMGGNEFAELGQTIRHSDLKTISLIRVPLWNKAKWKGTGHLAFEGLPPFLTLIFSENESAKKIFSHWLKELGEGDKDESLRVAIIRGINKHFPHQYRVILGSNIEVEQAKLKSQGKAGPFSTVFRIQEMNPPTSKNMDTFLESYKMFGEYFISPAVVSQNDIGMELLSDYRILKRTLIVREAWEIGPNDPDCGGIRPSDDPVIPEAVVKPPVYELLAHLAKHPASKATFASISSKQDRNTEKRKRNKRRKSKKRT